MASDDVVAAYVAAWDEPDGEARRALLERAWADDGVYCDPRVLVEGREALADHIGAVLAGRPGFRIVASSGVEAHHDCVRFGWRLLDPDGAVAVDGVDFGVLGADGRLNRIVGFFGPLPPL